MSRLLLGILAAACLASAADDTGKLPVKRVVLYKNGVGYFEHVGKVQGKQEVTIAFTSDQLNDVLKSLTALDLGGGRITGVEYGSAAPTDRQLGDLRLPVGDKASLMEFLGALRGARIEVRNGSSTISGRLLSVERKTRTGGGATLEIDYVSLLTDSGELRTTEVSPQFSVKLLDHSLAGRMEKFLDIVSSSRDADVRRMVISTEGAGERSLLVSYISEVPVWKSTYRIVLDPKHGNGPLLQGWAIVDNVVGQDWENVQLSLVAGAPQSFVQNLSQPYYARRPVVGMPESANLSPQTHQATLIPGGAMLAGRIVDVADSPIAGASVRAYDSNGSMIGATSTDASGVYSFQSLPEGAVRLQAESQGFQTANVVGLSVATGGHRQQDVKLQVGSVAETVTVAASAPTLQTDVTVMAETANPTSRSLGSGAMLGNGTAFKKVAAAPPPKPYSGAGGVGLGAGSYRATTAQELGDLFEYKLKDPITIQKNRSAMVPIVQSSIGAEKVSLWNERSSNPRPERALWLTNSTNLTLDGGSFSVLEDETFAGEGIFDPIRPNEKRIVSYATDLGLVVSSKIGSDQQRVGRVRISHGVLTQEHEVRERKTYTVRNEDTSARAVIIEHPVRSGYELRSVDKPIETTPDWMRFRLPAPSKQTVALVVEEARPILNSFQLNAISAEQVDFFVREKSINPQVEEALRKIVAQKAAIAELDEQSTAREEEASKIFDDQQRLRENMKALKGTPEEKALVQRYTKLLDDQENRLAALTKETKEIEARKDAAQSVLNRMIQDVSFDIRI